MTDPTRRRRRLAAILMADVVGFSRLMGRDEEGATDRIREFHALVRREVEDRGGRVVSAAGDSVFGDFDSIVEALECAVEIQRSLHADNHGREEDDRVEARIGLHLGDVIVAEGDVYGDGVNVAARLEQLAEPGGIALSAAVNQLVRGRTDLPIEREGSRRLKNIDGSMEIYSISPASLGREPPPQSPSDAQRPAKDRIRAAAERIAEQAVSEAERVADEVESGEYEVDSSGTITRGSVVAPIRVSTFVLAALGVLGLLAWTTDWSDNSWYPFVGSWLLGIVAGSLIKRFTGIDGLDLLTQGAAVAAGAFFFDNAVTRGILWVIAAGLVGAGFARMGKRDASR